MLHLPTKIKIGTRASKLAITQVNEIKKLLLQNSDLAEDQIEIIHITTSGDKIQDRNLAEIGGKGASFNDDRLVSPASIVVSPVSV